MKSIMKIARKIKTKLKYKIEQKIIKKILSNKELFLKLKSTFLIIRQETESEP